MSNLFAGLARWRRRGLLLAAAAVALALWLWPARQGRSDNFVFYLPSGRQLVPVETLDHARYVPLLKVLSLVGTVTDLEEKRRSLRVWVGSNRLDLHDGDRKLKLNRQDVQLESPVRLADKEWMVPLDFLYAVLTKLSAQPIQYRVGDERMFIGEVRALTFSARVSPVANGARLTVEFSSPVTVQTASTNGQWVIFLGDKALQPLEPQMQFQNRYVSGLKFDDADGVPKLIITPGAPGLNFYPTVLGEGRVFQADVTQPAVPQSAQAAQPATGGKPAVSAANSPGPPSAPGAAPSAPPAVGQGQATRPTTAETPPPPPLAVVVLDAGHGGDDAGGHSRDGVTERDLAGTLVDRVRASLSATGKIRVILTRQGSANPTVDERDAMANLARPVAFVSFHAGDLGGATPAAEVYTYQAPSTPASPEAASSLFVPWDEAQQAHLVRSRDLAGLLAQQLARVQGLDARNPSEAPVRQLRSIDAPAVAVELGTLAPSQDAAALMSAQFQTQVAEAVVQAVTALLQGAS